MGITAFQREQRKHHLGSSDVATLFGLNPFQSQYDIWLEKTGQLEPDESKTSHLDTGNEFEPVILRRTERILGVLKRNQYRSAKRLGLPLGANIDALAVEHGGRPVEAKTSGLFWPVDEVWGEEGTDEVPDRVSVQAHVHMITTDTDLCYVPALFWGLRFAMYEVGRDDGMVTMIKDHTCAWWDKHVVRGIPPEGEVALDVVKRVKRDPGKIVEVSEEDMIRWRRLVSLATKVEKKKKEMVAKILQQMGDAAVGRCSIGEVYISESERSGYVVEPKTSRTVRFRKVKE